MLSEQQKARIVEVDGDTWKVVAVGARRDGKVYLHLASTTRYRQQRNGKNPVQACDWFPLELIGEAA